MAKNRRFSGAPRTRTLPVIAGTVSGGPVIVGMLPGVALTDRDASGNAVVELGEAFDVSVTAAGSVAIGAPIYITSTTYALTDAAGAGKQLFGHALQTKSSGASVITVEVAPFAVAVGTPA
jgi:predicted RecA/RadA family phage recombinase